MENFKLKIIQLSDLHITSYRNLLEPMIDYINRENADLVVVTGDLVQDQSKESITTALNSINKITSKVVMCYGDYDYKDESIFGKRYKYTELADYSIEFMDTSYLGHKFASDWGRTLKQNDIDQYNWMKSRMNVDKYHLVFSHHPLAIADEPNEFIYNNLRACYSGHLHSSFRFNFKYTHPRKEFEFGFCSVPFNFHGNSAYNLICVKGNDEIINIPRVISGKITAW
jgi:predicted MPP superfamily phosphohydrolase